MRTFCPPSLYKDNQVLIKHFLHAYVVSSKQPISIFLYLEVKKRYEDFIRRNPDGRIKKEDFSPELRSWCSIQNAEKLETLVFEAFDANNDGYIDFKELMVVFYLLNNGR